MNFKDCRSLWLAIGLCGLSLPAVAQQESTCESDADCEHGYSCEVVAAGGCTVPDCAEGEQCPDIDCESTETSDCVITRDCDGDADCVEGFLCKEHTYEQCAGDRDDPGCNEGEDCKAAPADAIVQCETITESACEPPWAGECEEDADCGPGFECVELIAGMCSGSSGSAGDPRPSSGSGAEPSPGDGADGGAEDPDAPVDDVAPPECTSEPTGEFYCKLLIVECTEDSDCENGFTCEANGDRPVCGGGSAGSDSGGSGDADGGSDSAGDGEPESDARKAAPAPEDDSCGVSDEPDQVCLPPHYYDVGVDYAAGRDAQSEAGGTGAPTQDDQGSDPTSDEDGNENGGTNKSDDAASSSGSGESAEEDDDDSGCRAAGTGNAGGLAWLALSVLALSRRRKMLG